MAKKTGVICWSCGLPGIFPDKKLGKDWLKCTECGATHEVNPTVPRRIAPMETWSDGAGNRHFHPAGVHD